MFNKLTVIIILDLMENTKYLCKLLRMQLILSRKTLIDRVHAFFLNSITPRLPDQVLIHDLLNDNESCGDASETFLCLLCWGVVDTPQRQESIWIPLSIIE